MEKSNCANTKPSYQDLLVQNRQLQRQIDEILQKPKSTLNVFNKVQEIARLGSWYMDLATSQVEWSEELYKMYGLDPELPVPLFTEHMKLFTDESWKQLSAALNKTTEYGIPYELELKTIRNDKSNGWVWVHGEAVTDVNGKIIALWGTAQDISKQKENEQKLFESERFLNDMGAMSKLGGWQLNLQTNKLIWTNEVYKIHEVGKDFTPTVEKAVSFYHESSRKYIEEALNDAIKNKTQFDINLKIVTAKGNQKNVRAIGKTINNKYENAEVIFGIFQDITEKKQFDEEFIKKQYYLTKAQEIGKIGTWELDIINNNLVWTEENYKNFGLKNGTPLTYELFINCIHPDDRDYVSNEWAAALKGKPYDIEHRIIANGKVSWIREKAHVHFNEKGSPISAIGFSQDVTRFKESELKLQASQERFDLAMDASRDGLFDWDLVANSIYYSPGWKKMLGYKDHELPNDFTIWEKLTSPEDVEKSWNMQQELINKQRDRFELEFKMKHKKGHWIDILARAEAFFNSEGKAIRIVGTHFDITERKALRETLIRERKLLNETGRLAKIGGWELDVETMTSYYTQETSNIYGLTSESKIPQGIEGIKYYPKEAQEKLSTLVQKAIEKGQPYDVELPFINEQGKALWVRTIGIPEKTNDKVTRLFGTIQDISERKATEKRLKDKEAQYKILFENIIDEVHYWKVIKDNSGKIKTWKLVTANPSALKAWGKTKEQVIGKTTNEVFNYDAESFFMPIVRKIFKTGKPHRWDAFFPATNQYLSMDSIPLGDYFISCGRDVTLKKQAELELKSAKQKAEESEKILKTTLQTAMDGISVLDLNGRLLNVNDSYCRMIGYSREELLSMSIIDIEAKDSIEEVNKKIQKVIKLGQLRFETKHRHKDGSLIDVEVGVQYQKSRKGQFICFVKDISANKQHERDLIEAKEKAEESDRLKSAFLSNMSHEIRTPMNGILGFTSLLYSNDLSAENQKQYVDVIEKSGNRLLNTVNDIIEISKIESGEIKVVKSNIDLIGHLWTHVTFFKPEAQKKNIVIGVHNNVEGNKLCIETDKNKLDSLITNIIKNAIKYTNEGSIKVGWGIENNHVIFSCQDTGIGIDKTRQEAIFNRFEQADIEDKFVTQGSGLGLAIVKSYVELLGGKVWVESENNKGSTFYISLPYKTKENIQMINSQKEISNNSDLKNITLLIAEDDEDSIMFLSAITKKMFKHVKIAKNGMEAIEICKNDSSIDLILMDIRMPVIRGYEATKAIREFNTDVIIIAQTAYALEGDKEKALDAGCNDYISKPIVKDKLIELINKYF